MYTIRNNAFENILTDVYRSLTEHVYATYVHILSVERGQQLSDKVIKETSRNKRKFYILKKNITMAGYLICSEGPLNVTAIERNGFCLNSFNL